MKQTISILLISAMLSSCVNSNQDKAMEQAKQIQSSIQSGTTATTAGGYTMTAKLDGKEWNAASIMPPDAAGRIVGYNDGEYIGLPYDKRYFTTGKKITFSEDEAADLSTHGDPGMYGGKRGEMEITKVDDNWVEGKFFFTGSTDRSGETVEVTDGFFRIPYFKN
jgi:hypothetical protein